MPLRLLQSLEGHSDRVWTLAWNPLGTVLASSGGDKNIRLWTRKTSDTQWTCSAILAETHEKSIRRVCWSPNGRYLASASFDATVSIWKRKEVDGSWVNAVVLEGHESEVKSVAWSHDGQYLASCGRDKTIWIWERASAENNIADEEEESESVENWDCSDVKDDHTKDVKHLVWHPHHNILLSCSYDDTIKFFHKRDDDWVCYETRSSHSSTVWSADFSASGEFLVTCSDDKTVRVWKNHSHAKLPDVESNSWKCVSVLQGYQSRTIYDVSWCKLNDVIVSCSGDNSLAIYVRSSGDPKDSEIFECAERLSNSHKCDVNTVAWNPKSPGLLASGGDDCTIKMWEYLNDEKGMKPLTVCAEILQNLKALNFSTNQPTLGTAPEYTIKLTDFSNLLNLTQSLQLLQAEVTRDEEISRLEKLFDLKIKDWNSKPVELSNLRIRDDDGLADGFSINIADFQGEIRYKFRIEFDDSKHKFALPRRSIKLLVAGGELFLLEKTGDLYKISESGSCEFLLGHLFTFSDVKFITNSKTSEIMYILTADRDEKIRVSKYPNAYKIERFCFGHKDMIRRLVTVDDARFISIDHSNNAKLWNLGKINNLPEDKVFESDETAQLDGNNLKRSRMVYRHTDGAKSGVALPETTALSSSCA